VEQNLEALGRQEALGLSQLIGIPKGCAGQMEKRLIMIKVIQVPKLIRKEPKFPSSDFFNHFESKSDYLKKNNCSQVIKNEVEAAPLAVFSDDGEPVDLLLNEKTYLLNLMHPMSYIEYEGFGND